MNQIAVEDSKRVFVEAQLSERYEYRALLHSGENTRVFRAYDTQTRTEVAIKVIRLEILSDLVRSRSVRSEFDFLTLLKHQNIVPVLDLVQREGFSVAFTMPYLGSNTLHRIINAGALLGQSKSVTNILLDLGSALAHIHQHGCLHADLKPDNIAILRRNRAILLDFGSAQWISDRANVQYQPGEILGTELYLAPELIEGAQPSTASDVYAFGVLAYEAVTGFHPFETDDFYDTMERQLTSLLPAFPHDPGISRSLRAIIRKCCDRNPWERYASGQELYVALSSLLGPAPAFTISEQDSILEFYHSSKELLGRWWRRMHHLLGNIYIPIIRLQYLLIVVAIFVGWILVYGQELRVPSGPSISFRALWRAISSSVLPPSEESKITVSVPKGYRILRIPALMRLIGSEHQAILDFAILNETTTAGELEIRSVQPIAGFYAHLVQVPPGIPTSVQIEVPQTVMQLDRLDLTVNLAEPLAPR